MLNGHLHLFCVDLGRFMLGFHFLIIGIVGLLQHGDNGHLELFSH